MTYAYCRVSTAEQKEDRQLHSIAGLDIPTAQIFVDKQSGKDFHRPGWQALILRLKAGDVLYVNSIDRLGRNYEEILNWWRILTKDKGVDVVVLDMPLLDTRKKHDLLGTVIADVVLTMLSYIAHNERDAIRKRQAEGIAAARAKGVHLGRPPKQPPENFSDIVARWERGDIDLSRALAEAGLTRSTFYNRVRTLKANRKK